MQQIRREGGEAHALAGDIGVKEEIHRIADVLHGKGALLYMDGANMNALVGKTRPGDFGVDVMHLNLHKTFSTPHGGGGPGSGPVACKKILERFLPTPVLTTRTDGKLGFEYNRPQSIGRVRSFYGNFGMFVRALAYIFANGPDGLRQTTEDAVLNAITSALVAATRFRPGAHCSAARVAHGREMAAPAKAIDPAVGGARCGVDVRAGAVPEAVCLWRPAGAGGPVSSWTP